MSTLKKYRETVTTLVFALVCFLCYILLPAQGNAQGITSLIVFFVIFPILFQKLVKKEHLFNIGLSLGDWRKGLLYSFISLVISFALLALLFKTSTFQEGYSVPAIFSESFFLFLVYEFLLMGIFFACFSFFFNGFIMFSFEGDLKKWAFLFQFVFFLLFLFFTGSLSWLFLLVIINVFFGGWIALKSRSLLYPLISGLLFSLLADLLVIKFLL